MSNLVRNPEDRFSRVAAHIKGVGCKNIFLGTTCHCPGLDHSDQSQIDPRQVLMSLMISGDCSQSCRLSLVNC